MVDGFPEETLHEPQLGILDDHRFTNVEDVHKVSYRMNARNTKMQGNAGLGFTLDFVAVNLGPWYIAKPAT